VSCTGIGSADRGAERPTPTPVAPASGGDRLEKLDWREPLHANDLAKKRDCADFESSQSMRDINLCDHVLMRTGHFERETRPGCNSAGKGEQQRNRLRGWARDQHTKTMAGSSSPAKGASSSIRFAAWCGRDRPHTQGKAAIASSPWWQPIRNATTQDLNRGCADAGRWAWEPLHRDGGSGEMKMYRRTSQGSLQPRFTEPLTSCNSAKQSSTVAH